MLRWLKENGGSLFLSIVLALAIWVVAVRQQNPIEQREYPVAIAITLRGIEPGLVVKETGADEVRVTVRAPRDTLNGLTLEDLAVIGDLTGLASGTHDVPLQVEMHPDVQVLNAETAPRQVTVTLEERRERTVPVQVELVGEPAIGFGAEQPVVDPGSVVVGGPLSLVDGVSEAVVRVDVSDSRESVETELPVSVLDSAGNPLPGLDVTPERVQVAVSIDPLPNYKEIAVIVNHEGTAPAFGYYVSGIEVTPSTITVQGQPDVINQMPGFVRTALIDLTGVRDSFTRTVRLVLPDGVTAVGVQEVQVSVRVDAFQGSVGIRWPLEVVGLNTSLEAVLSPDSVDMIVSGPLSVLEQISQSEVRVVLDLGGLPIGTYQIAPEVVTLPEGVSTESLLPATIEVQIQRASATTP